VGAAAWGETTGFVEVKTTHGRVRGVRTRDVSVFKGIPYAGSVSGAGRFKAAAPLRAWKGVRDAIALGAPAPQAGKTYYGVNEPSPEEDCLFLNVWTPAADGRRRPVMFYNHGGGFTTGSGGGAGQDGANLARTWDVVVVATNHRLGLLGYLSLGELGGEEYATSGNQGLLDIRDGLAWVHDNIERFGGDPANVMIFGESGGGAKTSCLYALPSAARYFTKASIESGPGIRMTPRDVAAETTLLTLKELGLAMTEWRKLLDVPVDRLLAVQAALGRLTARPGAARMGGRGGIGGNAHPGGFGPVVDGTILPRHPFDPEAPAISKSKPLITGLNRDEATFFFWQGRDTEALTLTGAGLEARVAREFGADAGKVLAAYRQSRPNASPSELYVAIVTARLMGVGTWIIAERKFAQRAAPVFAYVFTHESPWVIPGTQSKFGAGHALEIPYKFNNTGIGGFQSVTGAAAERTAQNMSEMWSTFARTGRPGAQGQPAWPAWTAAERATMMIEAECNVVNDPWPLERRLWEGLS
jgi:para-nitrobenzyl esterase